MDRITVQEVTEALKQCVDPEIGIDIVAMGLVYNITVDESNNIGVRMTMTSPMCPITSVILADVQLRLEHLANVGKVSVELVWEPAWNPGMINDSARMGLNV